MFYSMQHLTLKLIVQISLAVAAVVAVVTYRLAITFAINRTWRDQRDGTIQQCAYINWVSWSN